MKTALVTTESPSHPMLQAGHRAGPHLPHCIPSINFTVSVTGNMTPKLAIKGWWPPQKQCVSWDQLLFFSPIVSPHLSEAKIFKWRPFPLKLWYLTACRRLCHTATALCASLKIKWSFKVKIIWGFSVRKTFFLKKIKNVGSISIFASWRWKHPILLATM